MNHFIARIFLIGSGMLALSGLHSAARAQLDLSHVHNVTLSQGSSQGQIADIAQAANGDLIATGNFTGTLDMAANSVLNTQPKHPGRKLIMSKGSQDIFLVRYDSLGNVRWKTTIGSQTGELASAIALDPQGNIFLTGTAGRRADFDPGPGVTETQPLGQTLQNYAFLAKYSPEGNLLWVRSIGGSTAGSVGADMAVASNGDVFWVGNFKGTVDLDPGSATQNASSNGSNYYDIFLARYSADGQFIWAKSLGSSNYDEVRSICVDAQDNFYIAGYFMATVDFDPGAGTNTLTLPINTRSHFAASYDGLGNFRWVFSSLSSSEASKIALDASNRLQLIGFTGTSLSTPNNLFYRRLTTSGQPIGQALANGQPGRFMDFCTLPDGGLVAVGYTAPASSTMREAIRAVHLDSTGNVRFSNNYTGTTTSNLGDSRALAVSYLAPNRFVFGGFYRGQVDFNPSSTEVEFPPLSTNFQTPFLCWHQLSNVYQKHQIGTRDVVSQYIRSTSNEGTVFDLNRDQSGNQYLGLTFRGILNLNPLQPDSVLAAFQQSGALAKFSSSGAFRWQVAFTGGNFSYSAIKAVDTDPQGNVYIGGYFDDEIDFDPGPGSFSLTPLGGRDGFVVKLDSLGRFLWAKQLGSSTANFNTPDFITAIRFFKGRLYVSGVFYNAIDLDPSPATFTLTSPGTQNSFVGVYSAQGDFIKGGGFGAIFESLDITADGQLVGAGNFTGLQDFDPGPGSSTRQGSVNTGFVAVYDTLLNFRWVGTMGNGVMVSSFRSMRSAQSDQIFVSGTFVTLAAIRGANPNNSLSLNGNSTSNFYLAAYSSSGVPLWAGASNSASTNALWDLEVDSQKNVYLAGSLAEPTDLDFGTGTQTLTPFGSSHPDAFIACYSGQGTYKWARSKSLFGQEWFMALAVEGELLSAFSQSTAGDEWDVDFGTGEYETTGLDLISYRLSCLNAPQILSAPPVSRCGSGSVTLTATVSAGTADWYNSATSSNPLFTGNSFVTPALSNSRSYFVALNTPGCPTERIPVSVTIQTIPTVVIGGTQGSVCKGTSATLTASGANSYSWSPTIQNGQPFIPDSTRTYTVVGTAANGCTDTASRTLVVLPLPQISIQASATEVCSGIPVTLTASGGQSYSWTGGISNGVPFVPSTTQRFRVNGTGGNGCQDTASIRIVVKPNPVVTVAEVDTNLCPGQSLTLTGQGAQSYQWSGGVANGQPFVPTAAGGYTVVGQAENGCSDTARIWIGLTVFPMISISQNGNTLEASLPPGYGIQWVDCNQNFSPIPGAVSSAFSPAQSGSFACRLSRNGCQDTSSCFPFIFTPIADTKSQSQEPRVYPNPTTRFLQIRDLRNTTMQNLEWYDAQGKALLVPMAEQDNEVGCDLGALPRGVYFLRIRDGEQYQVRTIRLE